MVCNCPRENQKPEKPLHRLRRKSSVPPSSRDTRESGSLEALLRCSQTQVFPKLDVYNGSKTEDDGTELQDTWAMKKNQKAPKWLEMLNGQFLEDTDEADFLVDDDKVQDANGAASEEDAA
jgi:hypothetical protein